MKAQSLKRLERSSPKTGDLIQTTANPLEAVMQDARPFRDKVVLVARNRVQRRTAVGYPATSGFPSKQDFPDQFQFRVPAFES